VKRQGAHAERRLRDVEQDQDDERDLSQRGEGREDGGVEQLVHCGIEGLAPGGDLSAAAGDDAVQDVSGAGDQEQADGRLPLVEGETEDDRRDEDCAGQSDLVSERHCARW